MPDTALLVIDIQNDYFPGGAMELEGAEAAGAKAGAVLEKFRKNGNVAPQGNETVVEKNFPNSFRGIRLEQTLKESGVKNLVVAGARAELCRRTGSRAASARRVPRRAQRFLRKGGPQS